MPGTGRAVREAGRGRDGSRASSPSPGEHGGGGGGSHRLIGGVSDEGKSSARLPWRWGGGLLSCTARRCAVGAISACWIGLDSGLHGL